MNVNYIHNETYAFKLPPTFLAQARALADFHEHGVFTSAKGDGLGNSKEHQSTEDLLILM